SHPRADRPTAIKRYGELQADGCTTHVLTDVVAEVAPALTLVVEATDCIDRRVVAETVAVNLLIGNVECSLRGPDLGIRGVGRLHPLLHVVGRWGIQANRNLERVERPGIAPGELLQRAAAHFDVVA